VCALLWVAGVGPRSGRAWADPPGIAEQSYEILEVYLSPDEALRAAFPGAARFEREEVTLTPEQSARVSEAAGYPVSERRFAAYRAMAAEGPVGYAVITDEIGKFHHITFLVGVDPDGRVEGVEVLVYRESRGGEVRHRRFLRQYDGKSIRDPIRLNRDIINITGATLSVRAINRGVRKVLGVLREAYGIG